MCIIFSTGLYGWYKKIKKFLFCFMVCMFIIYIFLLAYGIYLCLEDPEWGPMTLAPLILTIPLTYMPRRFIQSGQNQQIHPI
jgi:hypothetical protein